MASPADRSARRLAATLSMVVGVVMLGLKMGAYLATGSSAILSDALESVVHVVATGLMFFFFHVAEAPPDAEHPYGHGRAEHLSVGIEGGMILLAGIAIGWEAVHALLLGRSPQQLDLGLALVGLAALINLALGLHLLRVGRRSRSALLLADGQHVLSDVWTSAAVLVGVAVVRLLPAAWAVWIDGGVALLVALFLAWTAFRLLRQAWGGLMDATDPGLVAKVVEAIEAAREPGWLEVHNLRLRSAGESVYIDFHLTVPAGWNIVQAHTASDRIEEAVLSGLDRPGTVMVHLDYPHRPGEKDPLPDEAVRVERITPADAIRWRQ